MNGCKRHTDRVRELAAYIAGQPDETSEVTEQHLHVHDLPPGTKIDTDATGRVKAISIPDDDRETPTDPQSNVEPPPKVSPLAIVWLAVRRMPPWGVVLVALAATAAYVALHR